MFKIFLVFCFFLSLPAYAYVGSVSSATGETGRASVEASESPFGNPASLAYISGYYFTAGFGASHQNGTGSSQDLAVSLTDNMKDTVVPTSISYAQITTRPEGMEEDLLGRSIKLSFGNFLRRGVAFGLGITHQDDRMPLDRFTQTNVQTGFLWSPSNSMGVALVFDNMLNPSKSVPESLRLKQTIGFGASYNHKRFVRFKADVISAKNNTADKLTFGAGLESYMNRWLILRMGLQRNNALDANLYTAGMGFTGPKFGLHYAYVNSPQNESLTRHSVDLAVPIW